MSHEAQAPQNTAAAPRQKRARGIWGRIIKREPDAHSKKLEDRDMVAITAALLRLNERQLNRIGMSRQTLALDVEDLVARARREAAITTDVLRIVEGGKQDHETHSAIAAE
ncbi:MAG: hypothetical protein ACXIU7_07025 [Roseinatronobacter sp.]